MFWIILIIIAAIIWIIAMKKITLNHLDEHNTHIPEPDFKPLNLSTPASSAITETKPPKPDTMTLEEMSKNDCWCNNFSVPCYIAYDLETTGLSAETCEIIEIAAVKVEYHQIVDTFQELVKPKNKVPQRITDITGITNEMLENCRGIEEVLPDFIKFIEKYPMVAHNADFDYSFIKKHYMDIYGKQFSRRHYDTIRKYKKYYHGTGIKPDSCKLGDVIFDILGNDYYLDVYSKDSHRALTDATALYYIFEIINDN